MKTTLYDYTGKTKGDIQLNDTVFAQKWNSDLVHQVLVSYQSNMRAGTAHTKDRSEVSGGGKKPWKQKGTGRARHGSSRSPIWIHGGVSHGPRSEKDYSKKINDKMKLKALGVVFSESAKTGKIMPLSGAFEASKTKQAESILETLAASVAGFATLLTKKNKNNILICVPESIDAKTVAALRNIPCVSVVSAGRINALQVAKARYILLADAQSVDAVLAVRMSRLSTKTALAA
jgi:large subunit ribosomal protein L4